MYVEQVPLRRSTRERSAISDDYIVLLQEHEENDGMAEDDPINFRQAMQDSNSQKWIEAMNEEYKSMQDNNIWELVIFSSFNEGLLKDDHSTCRTLQYETPSDGCQGSFSQWRH